MNLYKLMGAKNAEVCKEKPLDTFCYGKGLKQVKRKV